MKTTVQRISTHTAGTGWMSGMIGVLIFSGSLPATRIAVAELPVLFLSSARAVLAACLAGVVLLVMRQERPRQEHIPSLLIVALGVVIGFPFLIALALQYITASQSIVFIGLLPLMTAIFGSLRSAERPSFLFWVFSLAGSFAVIWFAITQSTGLAPSETSSVLKGSLFMSASIIVCGLGYAEGAKVSKTLGGWQVISWSLLLSLPAMVPLALMTAPSDFSSVSPQTWWSLAYVSVFSMFVGFVFWYRGLALGGTASVGQLQLLQPFFGLYIAHLVLGEPIAAGMVGVTLWVALCVLGGKRFA